LFQILIEAEVSEVTENISTLATESLEGTF